MRTEIISEVRESHVIWTGVHHLQNETHSMPSPGSIERPRVRRAGRRSLAGGPAVRLVWVFARCAMCGSLKFPNPQRGDFRIERDER